MESKIYIVGLPAEGHPGGGRYVRFCEHLDVHLIEPPIRARFFTSLWGWRLDNLVTRFSPRPYYTFGLLLMECKAALHMLIHRRKVYHAVKGDVDLCLLPLVSKLTRNYLVASFHEPVDDLEFWRIDRWLTRHLAAVVLLSETQRPHFDKLLPPDLVHVVPHGVDVTVFHPPPIERGGQLTCITVGSHLRDAATLTQAIQQVWKVLPEVRLLVVGARRPHDPNPPPTLDDDRVEYLDHISDEALVALYHQASLAVISLKKAVANNALLEAMACGLPVVATDVGGIREYLGPDAGLLSPPGDPDGLANAMLALLQDPEARRRLGAAARTRAEQYDYRLMAEQMQQIYQAVLHDRQSLRRRAGHGPVDQPYDEAQ